MAWHALNRNPARDKAWRADVLFVAWQAVRRKGGTAGVDGETVADIESFGVER